MAEKTSNMPLQGELGLINYLQGIFSGKVANPNYTGASVPAPVTAPLMSGQDMQNIMTEFLRGNGQFLDQMRQQNLSGMYNSSTQKLVANDLTAQAALKASTANSNIMQGNAAILNNYNARVAAQQPKYLPNSQGGMGKVAAALGIAGLEKLLNSGNTKKGQGKSKQTQNKDDPNSESDTGTSFFDKITEMFNSESSSQVGSLDEVAGSINNMSIDPQSFLSDIIGGSDYGMSMDPGLNLSFDTGPMDYGSYDYVPDTPESFYDTYNTNLGYDFADYDEYFFD